MSYIQIEIGGKLRGLKFSQGTNVLLQDKLVALDESERKAFGVQFIIWAGLKTNCIIKHDLEGNTATFEDVCQWVELLPADIIMQVVNLYTEVNSPVPIPNDEEKKSLPDTVTEQIVSGSPDG